MSKSKTSEVREEAAKHAGPAARPIAVAAVGASATGAPDIRSMTDCIEDVRQAALDGDQGPEEPTDFHQLRGRLEAARSKFPPLYRQEFVEPYIAALDQLGAAQFAQILVQDPR